MGDHTGLRINYGTEDKPSYLTIPSDLNEEAHEGITIGKGKTLYWMMLWHASSGNVTVIPKADNKNYRRYISGDSEITIHFK